MLGGAVGPDQTGSVACYLFYTDLWKNVFSFLLKATHNIAEFLSSDFGSVDGEAGVLIQAIMSIKSIIKQDPPSHEKVSFILLLSRSSHVCLHSPLCLSYLIFQMFQKNMQMPFKQHIIQEWDSNVTHLISFWR